MLNPEDSKFLSSAFDFWPMLSTQEQDLLSQNAAAILHDQGENIHSGSNDCVGVILVKSGVLRSYILSAEGKEITLYRLYPGDICVLAASCLIKNITFDVHIDAEVASEILLINSATYNQLVQKNIYMENFTLRLVIDRFSDVMWAMEQILFMSFDQRLAVFLLDEASKNGSLEILLTHEQVAKYMGSAREVVSRMLKYFVAEGSVSLSRGAITILDKKKLQSLL
ncbi:MAG: Crp/Fnr family transcriptional regulator [Clostridia bacterium]